MIIRPPGGVCENSGHLTSLSRRVAEVSNGLIMTVQMAQFQKQLLSKTIKASMLFIQCYKIAELWMENFVSDDHYQGSFCECTQAMIDDVTM